MLTTRLARFCRLCHQAYYMESDQLIAILKDKSRDGGDPISILVRLACLRILIGRDYGIKSPSGLPYPQRKKAVRQALQSSINHVTAPVGG